MHLQGAQPVLFYPLKRFGAVVNLAPEYLCSLTEEARTSRVGTKRAQFGALAGTAKFRKTAILWAFGDGSIPVYSQSYSHFRCLVASRNVALCVVVRR